MELNNKNTLLAVLLIFVPFIGGCFVNLNNESLEEYGNKVMVTMATLVTYIGKSKEDVKKNFGEPTGVELRTGRISTHYQQEKVPFDEIWWYIYRRGIPGINAEGSTKKLYFNDGIVVEVDAF